jgi:hypothetical protein
MSTLLGCRSGGARARPRLREAKLRRMPLAKGTDTRRDVFESRPAPSQRSRNPIDSDQEHGTGASTARERMERRAARKRFVAQVETPNREIDLVGRGLASPAERHSKIFARCPQWFARVASDCNSCKTRFVPGTHQTGEDMAKAVARTKKAPTRRPWSKDDVRLLKGMARKEPAAKIAKALKRTEGATRQKAGLFNAL